MLTNIAKRVIEKYFLSDNEIIVSVSEQEQIIVIITNGNQWQIESQKQWHNFRKSDNYELLEVRLKIFADPPPRPQGIAIFQDEEMFHLNSKAEFCDFYKGTDNFLEAMEIAGILARYQGQGSNLIRNQNLIISQADLAGRLEDKQISEIAEFTPFLSTKSDNGTTNIDFCTYFLESQPPDYIYRFGLNRWKVITDIEGHIQWSVKQIASGLESSRYSYR